MLPRRSNGGGGEEELKAKVKDGDERADGEREDRDGESAVGRVIAVFLGCRLDQADQAYNKGGQRDKRHDDDDLGAPGLRTLPLLASLVVEPRSKPEESEQTSEERDGQDSDGSLKELHQLCGAD